jgi:hypothetical protein
MTPRYLHIANGTCTTRLIEAAGLPGARSIWADALYDGPVPGDLGDEALIDVRARHLAAEDGSYPDAVAELRRWRSALEDAGDNEIVLWFEHDLFDQLNLIQILSWIRERLPPAHSVSLVCLDSLSGRPEFRGLGELTPAELAPLLDARRPVTGEQYDMAQRAWQAFRQPTPIELDKVRRASTAALPDLVLALLRLLEEYPSARDGLSRTERRLLQLANEGSIDLATAWRLVQQGDRAYHITDRSLAAMVRELSEMSPPLLVVDRNPATGSSMQQATIATSGSGRAVMRGEADRVAMCGIDRWLGGVHLQGHRDVWRWDEERQQIMPSPPR